MAGEARDISYLAAQIAAALESADLSAFRDLLDPAVRWGPPGSPAPPCQSREQVLTWYRRGRAEGTRASVTETVVSGDRILVGMTVTGRPSGESESGEGESADQDRWQVLAVRDGRVTDIVGFGDRDEAAAWAGLGQARPAD
jgi:hypothetical protein